MEAQPSANHFPHELPTMFNLSPKVRTLLELKLIQAAGSIRNKKGWTQKIQSPDLLNKWIEELSAQGLESDALEYVRKEVLYQASKVSDTSAAPAGVPGTFADDDCIPESLQIRLQQAVSVLESGPKDWHPGSNQQVLDLVHPSLFPLVYGVSRKVTSPKLDLENCLVAMGQGTVIPRPESNEQEANLSRRFQWLPAEFAVGPEGSVVISSYINNLHPVHHRPLYDTIADIFQHFVPLFNATLTELLNPNQPVITVDPFEWYPEFQFDGHYTDPGYDEAWEEYEENREPIMPTVPHEYVPPPTPDDDKIIDLKGMQLQVIVKIASICLTPASPSCPGGSWHIEGMKNEAIVATGIYYFDEDNITPCHLAFRTYLEDVDYEQNDSKGVSAMYGLQDGDPMMQVLGAVSTFKGRCVCFPNTLQHKVQPFELQDKSRPGFRKILVFFLVDPKRRILSSADVPPQQLSWWTERMFSSPVTGLKALPKDVEVKVGQRLDSTAPEDNRDNPFSLETAKCYRKELMEERKQFVVYQTEQYFAQEFSLCEH